MFDRLLGKCWKLTVTFQQKFWFSSVLSTYPGQKFFEFLILQLDTLYSMLFITKAVLKDFRLLQLFSNPLIVQLATLILEKQKLSKCLAVLLLIMKCELPPTRNFFSSFSPTESSKTRKYFFVTTNPLWNLLNWAFPLLHFQTDWWSSSITLFAIKRDSERYEFEENVCWE